MTAPAKAVSRPVTRVAAWRPQLLRSAPLRFAVIAICFLWTLPTAGLFISSFRNPQLITQTGWWTALFPPTGLTLDNFAKVFAETDIATGFINSLFITIPATIIPVMALNISRFRAQEAIR